MSRIRKGKKYIYLGVFETAIEAHEEYKKALKEIEKPPIY